MRNLLLAAVFFIVLIPSPARAGAAAGPPGSAPSAAPIAEAPKRELQTSLDTLAALIDQIRGAHAAKPELLARLPDVQLYYYAVYYALRYNESNDVRGLTKAIADGTERARALLAGQTPWSAVSGPRGYISRIDGSVQPYLLALPDGRTAAVPAARAGETPAVQDQAKKWRVDYFFHGRSEQLTELAFINTANRSTGDRLYVQPYGRYCNASKFAGEIDALEILADLKTRYSIDDNRILDVGFSMGGATAWHLAVHYSDLFAAASPGAGFVETKLYQKFTPEQIAATPWWEQKLWHLYDCPDWAVNLAQLPTIAYAGEIDPQKQASDVMMAAMEKEGLKLERLIGPNTAHAYEAATKRELDRRLDDLAANGRDPVPSEVRFTTWTLRYPHMFWVHVDGMEHHWQAAKVNGAVLNEVFSGGNRVGLTPRPQSVSLKTENVASFSLNFEEGAISWLQGDQPSMFVDGTVFSPADLAGHPVGPGGAWTISLVKNEAGKWTVGKPPESQLRKSPGLQGPIDDAFLDSFMIVRPTGTPLAEKPGAWELAECDRAVTQWRKQFRGEARVKDDTQITPADIASHNLILFGDPQSNKLIAQILPKLPLQWTAQSLQLGDHQLDAQTHAPLLIYPNPLNPKRYVVINSGFTFREFDLSSNSLQTPKLPDWALVDVTSAPTQRAPAREVKAAGFFGERWEVLADDGR